MKHGITGVLILLLSLACSTISVAKEDKLGCSSGDCENGIGTLVEKTGDGLVQYRGSFKDGKYNGYGRLEIPSSKTTYKGSFLNGKKTGRGTLWDGKNSVYIGQWKNDRRNGMGLQAYHVDDWTEDKHTEQWLSMNAENYNGTFYNDSFDGEGTYRWPDGVSYTGGWNASKKNGRGYFLYPTGVRSDRIFEFDKRVYDEPLPR